MVEQGGFRAGKLQKVRGREVFRNIETEWLPFKRRMCQNRRNCSGTKDSDFSLLAVRRKRRFSIEVENMLPSSRRDKPVSSGLSSWPEDAFSCLVHRNVVALCQPAGLPGWFCRPHGKKTTGARKPVPLGGRLASGSPSRPLCFCPKQTGAPVFADVRPP